MLNKWDRLEKLKNKSKHVETLRDKHDMSIEWGKEVLIQELSNFYKGQDRDAWGFEPTESLPQLLNWIP